MTESTFINFVILIHASITCGLLAGMFTLARCIFRIGTQLDGIERWLVDISNENDGDDPEPDDAPVPEVEGRVVQWRGRVA